MAITKEESDFREHRARIASQSWYDVDSELASMLDLAFGENEENEAGRLSLTLSVKGTLISGTAVSYTAWKEALAANFDSDTAEALRNQGAENIENLRERRQDPDEFPSQRLYIHMADAKIWGGKAVVELASTRISLRDVSAWSFGVLRNSAE